MNRFPLKIFSGFLASLLMVGAMTGCKNPFSNGGGIQELNTAKAVKAPKTVKELSASAPVDADGDFIPTPLDACPDEKGYLSSSVKVNGCDWMAVASETEVSASGEVPLVDSCEDIQKYKPACEGVLRWYRAEAAKRKLSEVKIEELLSGIPQVFADDIIPVCRESQDKNSCAMSTYAAMGIKIVIDRIGQPVAGAQKQTLFEYAEATLKQTQANGKATERASNRSSHEHGRQEKALKGLGEGQKRLEGKFDQKFNGQNLEANFGNPDPPGNPVVTPPNAGNPVVTPAPTPPKEDGKKKPSSSVLDKLKAAYKATYDKSYCKRVREAYKKRSQYGSSDARWLESMVAFCSNEESKLSDKSAKQKGPSRGNADQRIRGALGDIYYDGVTCHLGVKKSMHGRKCKFDPVGLGFDYLTWRTTVRQVLPRKIQDNVFGRNRPSAPPPPPPACATNCGNGPSPPPTNGTPDGHGDYNETGGEKDDTTQSNGPNSPNSTEWPGETPGDRGWGQISSDETKPLDGAWPTDKPQGFDPSGQTSGTGEGAQTFDSSGVGGTEAPIQKDEVKGDNVGPKEDLPVYNGNSAPPPPPPSSDGPGYEPPTQ